MFAIKRPTMAWIITTTTMLLIAWCNFLDIVMGHHRAAIVYINLVIDQVSMVFRIKAMKECDVRIYG